jgi:16S rRNA (guanine527-N7)-methyltransferase
MVWRIIAGCNYESVEFEAELDRVLPTDLPNRERVIEKAVQHLQMIVSANEYMNLTRITNPQEAAVKHVYDCVVPWRHFADRKRVLDAGTGAGFPGIPLSLVLPAVRFTLAESIGKKARFVETVVDALELSNVEVFPNRAESFPNGREVDVITARAVAPISRICDLFGRSLRGGVRLLLFKGPEVETEFEEAKRNRVEATVLCRYELPDGFGSRTLVQLKAQGR